MLRTKLILVLSVLCSTAFAQPWLGILTPARATDWTQSGISGGIPSGSWTQCGSTLSSGANTATIQAAINACTANHYVLFGAGTFTLTAALHVNASNIELRGSGPTSTTIVLNGFNILMGDGSGNQGSTPGGLGATTLSTLGQGSTVLTVGSTSGLSVGQVVNIYQQNQAWVNPLGNEGNSNATWCPTPSLAFFGCSTRSEAEMVQITNVNPGASQITIAAPGLSQTYTSGLTPQVFFWSTTGPTSNDGIRNIKVDAGTTTPSDFAVAFVFCNFCWAQNIEVKNGHRGAIYSFFSYRDEIRDNYISESNTAGAPTQYGIECDRCGLAKIENNIVFGVTTPVILEATCGDVVGYNYTLNTATDNLFPTMDVHLSHACLNLFEGNSTSFIDWDFVHGSASHGTQFRNFLWGTNPNKTNFRIPFNADAYQRYMNVVGNVLGDPTIHTQYVCDLSHQLGSDNFIYGLGWNNGCFGGTAGYDATTASSLMRWGNWDVVTYAANGNTNGVRYCTGAGAGNAACTASETASTDPTFPGLASPATTFPASFYAGTVVHANCGTGLSFWKNPSSGFCPPYPPIGPDVTCTVNCIANTAAHATKIPAQLCYESGAKNGGGFLTAFDANTCYAPDISANQMIYRPTTFTDTGTNQTGGANPMVNPTFAYDGNPLTSAVGTAVHDGTGQGLWNITYFGFPANTTPNQGGVVLNVTNDWSVVPSIGTIGGANLEYSLNGGSSYTTIFADTTHGPTTDSIVLPNTQDFTQVRVHFFAAGCSPPTCTQTGHMTEVWISTQVIPSRLQGKGVWSGKGVIK